jgi:hypothetical protein
MDLAEGLLVLGIGAGIGIGLKNFLNKSQKKEIINKEKVEKLDSRDLSKYLKEEYSKIIDWNDNLDLQSVYVAGKKDFAKKLLENIDNKEEFFKIYNSEFTNEKLKNITLDKKYDVVEKDGIPINLAMKFNDFNINEGSLTEKIKTLMILWYQEGVEDVKEEIKYDVNSEDWDEVKFLLQKFLN